MSTHITFYFLKIVIVREESVITFYYINLKQHQSVTRIMNLDKMDPLIHSYGSKVTLLVIFSSYERLLLRLRTEATLIDKL